MCESVHVCIHVCESVHVFMWVCISVCENVQVWIYVWVHMCISVWERMCICIHVRVCMYECAHVFACEWAYVYLVRDVCMCVTGVDVFVCLLLLGTWGKLLWEADTLKEEDSHAKTDYQAQSLGVEKCNMYKWYNVGSVASAQDSGWRGGGKIRGVSRLRSHRVLWATVRTSILD